MPTPSPFTPSGVSTCAVLPILRACSHVGPTRTHTMPCQDLTAGAHKLALLCLFFLFVSGGCEGPQSPAPGNKKSPVSHMASSNGNRGVDTQVAQSEVLREVQRLPPVLREQFETEAGQREFMRALEDKKQLVVEARRRGLATDPDIARQVRELEERLIVRKMLEQEETLNPITEQEARAWFDANKESMKQPERVRVARVLAAVPRNAPKTAFQAAQQRAETFRKRLVAGELPEKVAPMGDGAEKVRGGDLGFMAKGDKVDKAVLDTAFTLKNRGQVSTVFQCDDGMAVLVLLDRREPRIPSFEEVQQDVQARMLPQRKRKVFDDLIAKLRRSNESNSQALVMP